MKRILNKELRLFREVEKEKDKNLSSVFFIFIFPLAILILSGIGASFALKPIYDVLGIKDAVIKAALSLFVTTGIGIIGVFLMVLFKEKRSISSLGLGFSKTALLCYIRGWLMGLGMMGATVTLMIVVNGGEIKFRGLGGPQVLPFMIMILGWVLQGALEEILMRGYMFPALAVRVSMPFALVASSMYFAILHVGNQGITFISFTNIVLVGGFTVLYALHEDNIWGVCGWHSAWNFAQGNLFGLLVSGLQPQGGSLLETQWRQGSRLLTGGDFGPEGSLIVTVVFIIGSGIIYRVLAQKQR